MEEQTLSIHTGVIRYPDHDRTVEEHSVPIPILHEHLHEHHEHLLSCQITSPDGIDILPAIDVVSLKVRYN
ncbi:hypothetical protein BBG47_12935 [Paenibacillus sp. KS1]|uniref:hypothetical protein n=1 Tax=Paenibacillus sp. KS1 TaxID=1849249 RepID=UPI000806718E|nr:hypothetical protein [Paenibacillus sp. KS1]OBY79088.1 hypothetical protein BBG47_12935 [Paenibacillus sp. KS1]